MIRNSAKAEMMNIYKLHVGSKMCMLHNNNYEVMIIHDGFMHITSCALVNTCIYMYADFSKDCKASLHIS